MQLPGSVRQNQKTVIAVLVSIMLFFFALFFSRFVSFLFPLPDALYLLLSRLAFWLALLLLFMYSRKIERQPLLLWNEKAYPVWRYIASVLLTLLAVFGAVIVMAMIAVMFQLKTSEGFGRLIPVLRAYPVLLVFTAITAGVTEELMFRGYLIPRLQALFKNNYIPVVLSSIVFGFLHFGYGTALNVIGPMLIGIVFGFHYVKYRNITILMIVHFLWDYILLLLSMRFATD